MALKGAVTAIELRAALDLGATIANSDAAIVLGSAAGDLTLVLEWDGHLWHTSKERVADDVLKTKRIRAAAPDAVIVRLRSLCGPIDELAGALRRSNPWPLPSGRLAAALRCIRSFSAATAAAAAEVLGSMTSSCY